ncbi:MAG: FlgD immunoglobulin-like domain containing protein [bacterium]
MRRPIPLFLLSAFVLTLFPAGGRAAWTSDPFTDVPVGAADGGQDFSRAVSDGSGGTIVAWEDGRAGTPGIYAQRLDSNGVAQWTLNGVLLSNGGGSYLDVAADGAGGAFVAWVEGGLARVQRVDENGVPQWTPGGEPANNVAGDQRSTDVVGDGAGGAFVVWQDYRSGFTYHVIAQHFDANGGRQWSVGGRTLSANGDWSVAPQADRTPAGDLVAAWYAGGSLKASCHSAGTGTSVWPFTSVVAADGCSEPYWKMISDGAGGTVVAFLKNGDRVYASRIDSTGTRVWATDVPVGTLASAFPITMEQSATHGAFVCWRDTRNGLAGTIAMQHLDGSGAALWPANGVVVDGTWAAYTGHGVCSDGAGGVLVEWQGSGGVRAQRVDAAGAPMWSPGGELVVAGSGTTYRMQVVSDGDAGAIVAYTWAPNVGSLDIRAEHVNADGSLGVATGVVVGGVADRGGVRAYPNPFIGSTTVEFVRGAADVASGRVDVLDVAGRRVRSLVPAREAGPESGRVSVVWDGRDEWGRRVPAGVYFVRAEGSAEAERLVRLR